MSSRDPSATALRRRHRRRRTNNFRTLTNAFPISDLVFAFVASAMSQSNLDILKASNANFTADFFQEVIKEKSNRSIVMSAFSTLSSLALWVIASRGPTRDKILQAIRFPNDTDVLKEQFGNINKQLQLIEGLHLANKVYVGKGVELDEEFAAESRDIFNSEVENIDFSQNVPAARKINAWVEHNTNHQIKNIVSPGSLGNSTAAVLVNGVYFKGNWSKPFNPRSTVSGNFHVSRDESILMRFMHQTNTFNYGESEDLDAKLLEMLYEGNQASFLAILPNKYDGISALVEKLKDPSIVSRAMENMRSHEVRAVIPGFEIKVSTNLKKTIINEFIADVFSDSADLSKITGRPDVHINKAVQKAVLHVSEEGSETAAANEFTMVTGVRSRRELNRNHKYFTADHPFYFALQIDNMVVINGIFVK